MNSQIEENDRVELNLKFVPLESINSIKIPFNWNFLCFDDNKQLFYQVRDILKIWNNNNYDYSYQVASKLIGNLATQYFKLKKSKVEHHLFFTISKRFIEYFGRDDGQKYEWLNFFKDDYQRYLEQPSPSLKESVVQSMLYHAFRIKGFSIIPEF